MFSLLVAVALFAGASCAMLPKTEPEIDPLNDNMALYLDAHLGVEGSRHSSRIINGVPAKLGYFPHQLTLLRNGYHICGASLIANNWAVTAAHCTDGTDASIFAVAGNFINFQSPGNYFYLDVLEKIEHPSYNQGPGGFPNDIALLRLNNTGEDLSAHFALVAEPFDGDFAGSSCFISGWGNTEVASTSELMYAEVTVLNISACRSYWGDRNILEQHICVKGYGGNGRGSCNGDSGGPLTCYVDDLAILAGATSWGRSGCHSNGVVTDPSVYARISYFADWIWDTCGQCW